MSTRKHSPRTRAFRPEADGLEHRQLLSAVVSGTDSKGDTWTLRLTGPGSLSVVKQNGADGNPAPLNSATDISSITVGGTNPETSRLVGTVTPAAGSDGRVFFQSLNELPSTSEQFPSGGLGLLSIDMPGFWLGNTTPASASATAPPTANISIPDGVNTLRFGGVDTTFNQAAATAGQASDSDTVTLGLPIFGGTRIVIDRSVSSSQQAPPASGSTTTTPTTVQHGVVFAVSGRLDLFQANSIDGDAAHPPGQFSAQNSAATGAGGTTVFSGTSTIPPFFNGTIAGIKGQVTGQIGDLRVGGNATNFTTIIADATGSGDARISNYSIGGETTNVLLVAPSGSRNVVFGKGMDTVDILSHVINTLKANRGALNSDVFVDRSISQVDLGGDVVNTRVLTGYQQNYQSIFNAITGESSNSIFGLQPPGPPPQPVAAQPFGGMLVHVAGDVTNSVFAASVEPFNNTFGGPNQLALTGGHIKAKVEGAINNSTATPDSPNQAFFAQQAQVLHGPVFPITVPEAPYTGSQLTTDLPGITSRVGQGSALTIGTTTVHQTASRNGTAHQAAASQGTVHQTAAAHGTTSTPGANTPKGPRASLTKRG